VVHSTGVKMNLQLPALARALKNLNTRTWLVLGAGATTGLALLAALQPLLALALGALVIVTLLGIFVVARPWHLFALYLFLLPPHVVLMSLLLVHVGMPAPVVKAISAWKEVALVFLLALAGWRYLHARWRLTVPDIAVLAYVIYALIIGALSFFGERSLGALAYGLRDLLLPAIIYLGGRALFLTEGRARRVFQLLLGAAFLFSVLGIIERLYIPTEAHVAIGIPRYFRELLNITTYSDWHLGLPENYWTSANIGRIRRAVSVYGSSQPFALSYLLLLPPALYGLFRRELPEHRMARVVFVVSLIALLLTITRFTILICFMLLLVGGFIASASARRLAARAAAVIVILFAGLFVVSRDMRDIVISTVTFQDDSSSLRLQVWDDTVEAVMRQPLGYGIGSVGQTALRTDGELVRIEGQVSKIAMELGVPGLLLYLALLLSISVYLVLAANRATHPYVWGLCFASALTFLGLAANALTTEWHNSPSLVYPAWWLAGACMSTIAARSTVEQPAPPVGQVDVALSH
jgi:hypothetical protein